MKKFADEFGVNAYVTGPSSADAAEQVNIIEDLINSGVDAICVVPNDATVLESVLQSAQDKGITVVTTESPDQAGAGLGRRDDHQRYVRGTGCRGSS
mgnify:CR=1 FL=1